jgi:hypothetical protein
MKEIFKIKASSPLALALKDNWEAQKQLGDICLSLYRRPMYFAIGITIVNVILALLILSN